MSLLGCPFSGLLDGNRTKELIIQQHTYLPTAYSLFVNYRKKSSTLQKRSVKAHRIRRIIHSPVLSAVTSRTTETASPGQPQEEILYTWHHHDSYSCHTTGRPPAASYGMPRRRCDLSRLTSRAVHLILFACWVALVVWRIFTFISEPTASETRFEDDFNWPYLTCCPVYVYQHYWSISSVAHAWPNQPQDNGWYENHTLLAMFKEESSPLRGMRYTLWKYLNARRYIPHRDIFLWFQEIKFNYAEGGVCATLKTSEDVILGLDRGIISDTIRDPYLEGLIGSYYLFVHKLDDFWGGWDEDFTQYSESEMTGIIIHRDTTRQEIEIHPERDIMPNLRRRPCVEDPNYSRSMCWRDCYLDSLNCSLLEGDTSGKPICMAADNAWFWNERWSSNYDEFARYTKKSLNCSCPRPCSLYRYKLSIKPNVQAVSDTYRTQFKVSLSPAIRTTNTYVTYDIIDLLADIGGFVGLLLGYSLLSVFEDFKNLVTKLFRKRAASAPVGPPEVQQRQDSNVKQKRKKRRVKQGWRKVSSWHRRKNISEACRFRDQNA